MALPEGWDRQTGSAGLDYLTHLPCGWTSPTPDLLFDTTVTDSIIGNHRCNTNNDPQHPDTTTEPHPHIDFAALPALDQQLTTALETGDTTAFTAAANGFAAAGLTGFAADFHRPGLTGTQALFDAFDNLPDTSNNN
ncbi:hypothetical protein ACWDUL_21165 [Nocardia niigatensis]